MEKVKIALGVGRTLGIQILKWISSHELFDVVAVCPVPHNEDPNSYYDIQKVIEENNYRQCDIEELLGLDIDVGLSVNYHRIIRKEILDHCRIGFYNVHHSYNMRLRGRNISTHALLNTLDENIRYHGSSIHLMVEELDAGPIVSTKAVEIEDSDTAYSLFCKANEAAYEIVKEWLPRIVTQKIYPYYPPIEGIHKYLNLDIPDRRIDLASMSQQVVDVYIRAFDFPGKEPAFLECEGVIKHLVFSPRDEYITPISLGDKTYYTE